MFEDDEMNIEEAQTAAIEAMEKYFSRQEWSDMSEMNKEHYVAQMRNYYVLQKLGVTPKLPEFVLEFDKREARKKAAEMRRLKAQEEGVTKPKKKKVPMETRIIKGKFGYAYGKVKKKVLEGQDLETEIEEEKKPQRKAVCAASTSSSSHVKSTHRVEVVLNAQHAEHAEPRYPRRNVPRRNYKEDPEPDDDDYFYCDHCGDHVLGTCVDHGKPFRIFNKPAPAYCEDRALRTLPNGLSVRQSSIPGAGLGVFADRPIPPFVQMGPYEGPLFTQSNNDGYCWQIRRTGQNSLSVDAKDINKSSWLRYVDCACHDSQQNLSPYQHKGMIFYMTRRWIWPGDELLTWYGKEFMQELGIDMVAYFKPLTLPKPKPKSLLVFERRGPGNALKCPWCTMAFSAETFVQRHVHCKHGSEHSLLVLQHKATVMFPPSVTTTAIGACFVREELTASLMNLPSSSPSDGDRAVAIRVLSKRQDKEFVCDVCNRSYTCKGNLNSHKKIHDTETVLKCEYCSYKTGYKQHLQTHMLKHSNVRNFECTICAKTFTFKCSLMTHVKCVHEKSRDFKCKHCDKTFGEKGTLDRHMRMVHTNERPYSCDECDFRCVQSSDLTAHMRTHSGEKPYSCTECNYNCVQSSSLTAHIRTHSGEKPYSCTECDYSCTISGNLTRHMRTHSGEKPYSCTECDFRCARSSSLTRHMRRHTGEKPYRCTECDYSCTTSSDLTKHMRTHTGERPY